MYRIKAFNLISESPNTSFILAGDFNLTGNGFHPKAKTRHSKLKQIIKEPTRGSNILDLVFTDTVYPLCLSPHEFWPLLGHLTMQLS